MMCLSDQGDDIGGNRIKHIVAKVIEGGLEIIESRWALEFGQCPLAFNPRYLRSVAFYLIIVSAAGYSTVHQICKRIRIAKGPD